VHSIAASLFLQKDQIHFFNDIGYFHVLPPSPKLSHTPSLNHVPSNLFPLCTFLGLRCSRYSLIFRSLSTIVPRKKNSGQNVTAHQAITLTGKASLVPRNGTRSITGKNPRAGKNKKISPHQYTKPSCRDAGILGSEYWGVV
jgi:hypothetical protein